MAPTGSDWSNYRQLVISEFDRITTEQKELRAELKTSNKEILVKMESIEKELKKERENMYITLHAEMHEIDKEIQLLKLGAAKYGAIAGFLGAIIPIILTIVGLVLFK